jgi:exodeoxyribonuclease-3
MKIATFNVNSIGKRESALIAWLKRESPDIVCLQELKAPDERFPALTLRAAGYGAVWHGQTSYNGVAILARDADPVLRRRGLPGDPDDTHSRYIEAQVNDIVVGCLYLPNGNPQPGPKFDYKLAWFERLIQHAAGLLAAGGSVILAGDYNVVPTDKDIYDPKNWRKDALLQPASRDAFARLLAQGWTDSLRKHLGAERIYTYWDYWRKQFENNRGLRIDHLLLSPALAGQLTAAGVDRWVRAEAEASDHAPTWVELR